MSTRILLDIEQHVARVTLCRPDKMNALDQASFDQLASTAAAIAANHSVRVVILSAQGPHFCAGADKSFLQGAVSKKDEFVKRALVLGEHEIANEFQKPCMGFHDLDVPVIACVNGIAYGAGMQLALAADFRIGASATAMSLFEINWGLIPDMAITQTLPRLVRADIALDLTITGRVVKGDEALQLGLLTRVVSDPSVDAEQLAAQIVARSPDAVKRAKRLLRDSYHLNKADSLALEAQLQSELVGTQNQLEAARANLEKRTAVFTDSQ